MNSHEHEQAPSGPASSRPASSRPASTSPPSPRADGPLHGEPAAQVRLRGPGQLADALPYLLGFHPDDSIVLIALHGDHRRFGGRIRLGIPSGPAEWPDVAQQLAACLETSGSRRPDAALVFLCSDGAGGGDGGDGGGAAVRAEAERLRPLAQSLRTACGRLDIPVVEALCLTSGRYVSYVCSDQACCPPEGRPLAPPGSSVMAASAAYAGVAVRGSLRQMEARFEPVAGAAAVAQERALDAACAALVPRMLGSQERSQVSRHTVRLADRLLRRLAGAPGASAAARPVTGAGVASTEAEAAADAADDALLGDAEVADLVLGLQDRTTRDRVAEWMEGPRAGPALRLWRALSRRCVGPYLEHAAAPLTLAGWVAWSRGDEPGARVALGRALSADPEYLFAQLLHRACNDGVDPEPLREAMRRERVEREAAERQVRRGGPPRARRAARSRVPAQRSGG